ncbi:uncharacterized protein B0H64DRAFT_199759 [Chaetomium fimeti]|uniref:Uncharacterized protein n=1 Tax=Chaetomium fimeti TaxID=1854472 RepID=A0AAE0HEI4_9PEZI|nr:hypothetical protein B0H64DRAFT_199759 [Chaetomium fimeti]
MAAGGRGSGRTVAICNLAKDWDKTGTDEEQHLTVGCYEVFDLVENQEFDEPTPAVTLILPHKRRQYLRNGMKQQRIRFSNRPRPASGQWGSGNVLPSLPHCIALQLAASDNGTAACPREARVQGR